MEHPLPKIALVGRPNVGKSALFNRICQRRVSIVDEQEGVTRDRLYAEADLFGRKFLLIDTGGIDATSKLPFNEQVKQQAEFAIEEADVVILVVDGQVGPIDLDKDVAQSLLRKQKSTVVAVNKIDRLLDEGMVHQFHSLGLPQLIGVSATQGYQIAELVEAALAFIPIQEEVVGETPQIDRPIRVTIAGRSNVGKSTLLNRLLKEERSIVSPIAGTTRDAIDVPLVVDGQDYVLIDTAGIRRKKAEQDVVEKFAAIRTQEAIERSDVVLLILDSYEGLTAQEKRIASDIETMGKSCIILFNKWDLVSGIRMEHALRGVHEAVPFLAHCPTIFLSAKEGRNIDKIFPAIREVFADRHQRIGTGALNKFVEDCVQKYHPPMMTGKRLRIYYMTQVETAPPRFVFFVNQPKLMTEAYRKYLLNRFRESYRFSGCPLFFELRGKGPGKSSSLLSHEAL